MNERLLNNEWEDFANTLRELVGDSLTESKLLSVKYFYLSGLVAGCAVMSRVGRLEPTEYLKALDNINHELKQFAAEIEAHIEHIARGFH